MPHQSFLNRLLDELRPVLTSRSEKAVQNMRNVLLGIEEERTPQSLSPRNSYFADIFWSYNEIHQAHDRLKLAQELLSGSSRPDVIAYHVEKHLEEVYILKGRMVAFARKLKRLLLRKNDPKLAAMIKQVEETIESSFEGIVKTRGSHVHEYRYADFELKRLVTIDLLVENGEMKELADLKREAIDANLERWGRTMKANIEAVEILLDKLCEMVTPIVFEILPPPKS